MTSDIDRVLAEIDRNELVDLALTLGNIDSPPGQEKEVAEHVEAWLQREGLKTSVLSLLEERPNVIGTLKGTGGGYSLLFNSHMDTSVANEDIWNRRNPRDPILHKAWQEGAALFGNGLVNDKGPMACFLIAAKAIKKAGIPLKGDLLLTAVSGEIPLDAVDDFQSPAYPGKFVGTRWIVTHGAIADYALVAEATNFQLAWVEAGKLFVKITVFGKPALYTPFITRPYKPEEHPNAIFQMTRLVQEIDDWALTYEKKHTLACDGGTIIPKIAIGAIKGGRPYAPVGTSEVCALYLDIRTVPGQDMLAIKAELEKLLQSLHLEGEVQIYLSQPGFTAKAIEPLAGAVTKAHQNIFKNEPKTAVGPISSMWRDLNVFNEIGIPSLTYGPAAGAGGQNFAVLIDDFHRAAQAYAMIAIDICNREK